MNKRTVFRISLIIATLDIFVLFTRNDVFRFALISNDYESAFREIMKTVAMTIIGIVASLLILLPIGIASGLLEVKKVGKDEEDE